MKKKSIRDTPVIVIPKGYTIDDLMDFDDDGYENGEPVRCEEVKVVFEYSKAQRQSRTFSPQGQRISLRHSQVYVF